VPSRTRCQFSAGDSALSMLVRQAHPFLVYGIFEESEEFMVLG
jgi:hypothetical protein